MEIKIGKIILVLKLSDKQVNQVQDWLSMISLE